MAAVGGNRAERLGNTGLGNKSNVASPEKVRALLNDGVSSAENTGSSLLEESKVESIQAPCEATNKEAFFSRVESYSCLKWAGKPRALSPLMCARFGWINVGPDLLKCSSCQAFLCASLQPTLDFHKYQLRVEELTRQLQTQHEKFCSWPDFPCPERIWLVPASEPSSLLASFLERFQGACVLAQQLPALKTEQLKSMCLTEDVVSVVLQIAEEEQRRRGGGVCSEPLAVQVAACIVALCGWSASPALRVMNLPILTCSYCKRKVGLWNFYQMEESSGGVWENVLPPVSSAGPGAPQEAPGDCTAPPPTAATPPCRMKLRSQDSTRSDQGEAAHVSPQAPRAKSRDSTSPTEELPSPKGKRPGSRGSRGPGDPPPNAKRPCLSPPDDLLQRSVFDPLAQHRDWCPWVAVGIENREPGALPFLEGPSGPSGPSGGVAYQQGWKAALDLLIPMKKNSSPTGGSPAQARDKSKRVFAIFQQWQLTSLSQ